MGLASFTRAKPHVLHVLGSCIRGAHYPTHTNSTAHWPWDTTTALLLDNQMQNNFVIGREQHTPTTAQGSKAEVSEDGCWSRTT